MDTRQKIITADEAVGIAERLHRENVHIRVVSGFFDVLQPSMVRDLQQDCREGETVFALVLDPVDPVTSPRARTELAAALRMIHYVVPLPSDPSCLINRIQPDEWTRAERAHGESTERLIRGVFERHGRRPPERRHSH